MNCRKIWLLPIILLAFSHVVHGEKKVTLCHFPAGNPANLQTILVSEAAVPAHIAHGDLVGACTTVACPSSCDDGNLCTSDSCGTDGQCVNSPVSCDDDVICTLDVCDPNVGCLQLPNDGISCNDGNDCTSNDACSGTQCQGTAIAGCCIGDADCNDGDSCTDDTCFLGSCQNKVRTCAVENKCLAGFCNANSNGACDTTEVSCDDSNVCTDDACDPITGCTHIATSNPPESVETSCTDTADNDCDGAVDGIDPDCHVCGDGVVQPNEQCDDGNDNPFDGCDDCITVDITPD
jgi:cysteine-rich repeat protein